MFHRMNSARPATFVACYMFEILILTPMASLQVLISGYAYGGLSEVQESEFLSCSMASTIANDIGVFGHKPSVLSDMLAGKRVEGVTKVGAYMRTFSGDCSPSDLETALQVTSHFHI